MKLPAGTHTFYWKVWLKGYTMKFDSGTLTVVAIPCAMGGSLQATAPVEGVLTGVPGAVDEIVTTKDTIMPNMDVTLFRAGTSP